MGVVDLVIARKHVLSLLNVSKGYTDASVDPGHHINEATETIIQWDCKCYEAILLNEQHGSRASLLQWTNFLAQGVALPPHITRDRVEIRLHNGDPGQVLGIETSAENLALLRANSGGIYTGDGDGNLGYYNLDGGIADFTGDGLRFRYGDYVRANPTACLSPEFCYSTIVTGSLSMLMLKDGDDLNAAQLFQGLASSGMSMILSGRADMPELPSRYKLEAIPQAMQHTGG
jgi:hypothetical protein